MLYNSAILCKGEGMIVISTCVILKLVIIPDMNLTQQLQTCHCLKTFRFRHQSSVAHNTPSHYTDVITRVTTRTEITRQPGH